MNQKTPLWVLFNTPGRARFCLGTGKDGKKDAPNLDDCLGIDGVSDVSFNKVTRSLLVIYDADVLSFDGLVGEMEKRMPYVKVIWHPPPHYMEAGETLMSSLVLGAGKNLNQYTRKKLRGSADISSMAPVLLSLLGIGELVQNPVVPKWYDFFWYATNMYMWQIQHGAAMPNYRPKKKQT